MFIHLLVVVVGALKMINRGAVAAQGVEQL
jgi:hypothetical protein